MKITIELPGPVSLTFEGDGEEFERFTGFVSELPELIGEIGPVAPTELGAGGEGAARDETGSPLEPAVLQARFARVGASNDIERVTVIAQAAVEAGREGAVFEMADTTYTALALSKPARWKVTFGNARSKGYLQNVGRGIYKPTVPGENFANGLGGAPPKKRSAPKALVGPNPLGRALEAGEE